MLNKLLPTTIDNTYRGRSLGLWLLWIVIAVKVVQIVSVMIDGPGIVAAADGIPLATFPSGAAQTVVAAFIGMGISRLMICVLCGLVLLRYRSAVAPIFALLALHDIAREALLGPIRIGTPLGPLVNWAVVVMTFSGVALSVWERGNEHDATLR